MSTILHITNILGVVFVLGGLIGYAASARR